MSTPEREHRDRAHRYNATLSQLKWGATRADLQRLFPPVSPPRPFTTSGFSLPGPGFAPELYPLDADFAVPVTYYYQRTRQQSPRPHHSLDSSHRPPLDSATIHALLFGHLSFRIYPQLSDRIATFPLRVQPR
jgi:hypothetical protein